MHVDPDISLAKTPDKRLVTDPTVYPQVLEGAFARSWQWVGEDSTVRVPGATWPQTLLEGSLDEPIVFVRDMEDQLRCFANVCTHRGMTVCEAAGNERFLRCRYHGRRFGLDGKFQHMPEFEGVQNFPCEDDDLPKVPFFQWARFLFASANPAFSAEEVFAPMIERLAWMPVHEFQPEPQRTRDYMVRANWALYVDNYLEGFHIPFVHADLNAVLDYGNYHVEKLPHGVLQLAYGQPGEAVFDLPPSSPDYGKPIAAYYYWFFPNLMFNFYPWGLSVNVVKPLGPALTRVSFIGFVWDASKMGEGAGAALDRVEREDEVVVEAVQRGIRSRFYKHGRYSVAREDGTHHFHRLLTEAVRPFTSGA